MDPSDFDKRDQGNGSSGGHGPTHANGGPPGGDGWLRSALENSSEVVKVVDPDGTLRYASPAFGWILGYDPVEAAGTMNVLDHVHPDDLPRVLAESEKALAEGRTVSNRAEYRFRHKDGSWRWVESVGTYLLDDPAVGGVVVTVRDITWRKEAEERLRLQAQLLGAVGEAVIALDADRKVVYWNRVAEEMYGFSSEEVLGRRLMDRVVPEDLRTHAEEVMAGVRAGLSWKGEFVVRRKDGTPLTVEASNTPVFADDGEQVGVVGVLRDVTERKEAEAALRRSEAELFSVLESITDGFFVLDHEMRFAYVNPQAALMMERAREDLIGEKLWEDATFYPRYQRALGEAKAVTFEEYYPPLERWYSVRVYPSETGLSVYVQDVTERKGAEEKLREAEERYRTLVEKVPPIIYIQTPREGETAAYDTTYISPRVEEVLGYPSQMFTEEPGFWDGVIHPEDLGAVLEEDERTDETGESFFMEYRVIAEDGRTVWIRDEATLVQGDVGQDLYWLGVQTDITESKEAEERLAEAEGRYRTLVEHMPAVTYVEEVGEAHGTLYMSPQIEDLLGYSQEEWLGDIDHWKRRIHSEDRERVLAENARSDETGEPFRSEYRMIHRDGRTVWVHDKAVLVEGPTGRNMFWQGVMTDITDRKVLEERLEQQALHDPLTGLSNRRLFADRLAHALESTRRRDWGVAILFMDLNDFKVVNDSLGHETGDLLLTVVAERLGRCIRLGDTLARFGGDEFVVLVDAVEDPGEAVEVARRVTDELRRPFALEGRELYVSASVGISFGTARTKTPEDLLREADTAMYRAKEGGGGYQVFDPIMHERVAWRLDLENDLRRALERGELVLHYQPVIDLGDQHVWGTEALLRWDHPERGLLGPSEFVSVAEETGLIVPIGAWALEEACRQTKGWQDAYPHDPPLGVIVNLSANQLRHPGCEGAIRAALDSSGLPPQSLSLDVTETAFIDALEENSLALERIRALGVRISIDDFGMGYSSLSYLKRLPADARKIDRSFLVGLGEDARDTALVRMVIDVGHTLGMRVIAEGVEEWAQAALLAETGCDMAQGYHFSGPLPPEQVTGFLRV